jgi:hypothetical protein
LKSLDRLLGAPPAAPRGGGLGGRLGVLGTVGGAALLDLGQAVVQRLTSIWRRLGCPAGRPAGRIAAHDPDVAQHLVEHARRAAGAALAAQFVEMRQASSPSRRMTISRSENDV